MPNFRKPQKKTRKNVSILTLHKITKWVRLFHKEEGYYPTGHERKPVPTQSTESWGAINSALIQGRRGLPGDDSLTKLRNRLVGLGETVKVIALPENVVEVEPVRKAPLVTPERLALTPQLPLMDRQILTRYLAGEKQQEIADLFSVTQAAISYKIERAVCRLRYLEAVSAQPADEFESTLKRAQLDPQVVKTLVTLRRLTGIRRTAQTLKTNDSAVRTALSRAMGALNQLSLRQAGFLPTLRQLELLRDNPAIMQEFPAPRK